MQKKGEVEAQEQEIRQKVKINKSFGQLSGEDLFKPITLQMDAASRAQEQEALAAPDYNIDNLTEKNPLIAKASGRKHQNQHHHHQHQQNDNFPPPPSPLTWKTWDEPTSTKFLEGTSKSVHLQTGNRLITRYGDDSNYRVKAANSKVIPLQISKS